MKTFDEIDHAVGSRFPYGSLTRYPLLGFRQSALHQLAGARAPRLSRPDQAAALEQRNMLHERRQRHVEWRCKHGYRLLAPAERADDRAPGRIGESVEDVADASLIVSHVANYRS